MSALGGASIHGAQGCFSSRMRMRMRMKRGSNSSHKRFPLPAKPAAGITGRVPEQGNEGWMSPGCWQRLPQLPQFVMKGDVSDPSLLQFTLNTNTGRCRCTSESGA